MGVITAVPGRPVPVWPRSFAPQHSSPPSVRSAHEWLPPAATALADPTAPRKLFDAAEKSLGFVSILVHSASPRRRENETALAVTESEWDSMVTVGLRAGFVLGQAAGAQMQARKIKGRMLFITSLHAGASTSETSVMVRSLTTCAGFVRIVGLMRPAPVCRN